MLRVERICAKSPYFTVHRWNTASRSPHVEPLCFAFQKSMWQANSLLTRRENWTANHEWQYNGSRCVVTSVLKEALQSFKLTKRYRNCSKTIEQTILLRTVQGKNLCIHLIWLGLTNITRRNSWLSDVWDLTKKTISPLLSKTKNGSRISSLKTSQARKRL
jgi:hypothetical protein